MMKIRILFFIVFIGLSALRINAQHIYFEQVLPDPPAPQGIGDFQGVYNCSVAFADIDNDSDLDLLVTGTGPTSRLYMNDGSGNFSELNNTSLEGVGWSSASFADIDSDNDQDVIISGYIESGDYITALYNNDGTGIFTEVSNAPFEGVMQGSIVFADIDGDNDQDVLITGRTENKGLISKLYNNDGTGNFTEVSGSVFEGAYQSAVAFSDIDGDNDQDVLITGSDINNEASSSIYINDGSGNFSADTENYLEDVYDGSIDFSDIDGDNDQDVLITGRDKYDLPVSKLYGNDGFGNFDLIELTPFPDVFSSSVAFSDIDGDNDQDLLITGFDGTDSRSDLFINDGTGNFSQIDSDLIKIASGSIAFADVDGDNDEDLITSGSAVHTNITLLYQNDGIGNFIPITGSPFTGVEKCSVSFADVDNDSDQDILITGKYYENTPSSELYINDGFGRFTKINTSLENIMEGAVAFEDIDNDNDQDLLIAGFNGIDGTTVLYKNDGSGNYAEVPDAPFTGVSSGTVNFADIDGDNDQDVLITGAVNCSSYISKLYTNDGSGNFTEMPGTPFVNVYISSVAFSDIDSDNDQDVLITGNYNGLTDGGVTKLYQNDGSGVFTEIVETPFDSVYSGSVAFADLDGDDDEDLLITGRTDYLDHISKLYRNNGSGVFTEIEGQDLIGVYLSSVSFSDIDSDNDKDLLITGSDSNYEIITKLYQNDGSGNFSEFPDMPFDKVTNGSVDIEDIDGDNDQDILISGLSSYSRYISKLYRQADCLPTSGTDIIEACNSYTWIDGITYTESNNTATFILPNSAGCDSVITLNLTIHTIDKTVTQTGLILTANETDAEYQWLDCNDNFSIIPGEIDQSFTVSEIGSYAVEVIKDICMDTSVCIDITSLIIENSLYTSFNLYPNPTTGILNIDLDKDDYLIKIYSMDGNLLSVKRSNQSDKFSINIAGNKGVYFIEFVSENKNVFFKVIKI